MARKTLRKSLAIRPLRFDSSEFLLLLFVVLALLIYFGWRMNLLPTFFTNPILGASTAR